MSKEKIFRVNEPDIVKEMKEQEKIGMLNCRIQDLYEKQELMEETSDNVPDETVSFIEDDIRDTSNNYPSKDFYLLIAENTSDLICTTTFSMKPKYTYVNSSYKKILGYEREELIGKNPFDFIHPEDKKNLTPLIKKYISMKAKKLFTGKENEIVEKFENRMMDKEGNWLYFENTANLLGNKILIFSKNITEKKKVDERFRMIANVSTDLIYEWDVKNDTLEWFGNFDEILGYTESEIPRNIDAWVKLIHPDDLIKLKDSIELHRKSIIPIYEEYRVKKKDGTWLYCEDRGTPILNEKGLPDKWIGGCSNVSERKNAETMLIEREKELRFITESSLDIIFTLTKNGKITYINPSSKEFFGLEPFEMIGTSFTKYVTKGELPKCWKALKDVIFYKNILCFETYVKHCNGSLTPIEINGQTVDRNGKLVIQGTIRDISNRKKNEGEIRIFNKIIETTSQSVIVTNIKGTVQYVNPSYCAFSGFLENEVIGKSMFRFACAKGAISLAKDVIPALLKKGHWRGEMSVIKKDKQIVPVDLICSLLTDEKNKPERFVAIFSDITDQKQAEEELKEAHQILQTVNKDLERKVEIKTEEIQNQNDNLTSMNEELNSTQQELKDNVDKVEKLVEQKDEFIHMLGHDLKNPMTPIFTLLPIIEKKLDDEQSKNMIHVVIQSTKKMKEIIDETLKLARLDDVGHTIEPVDIVLFDEIESIIESNKVLLDENEFIIENNIDNKLHAMADKFQFGELINNFITNAIKYTPDEQKGIIKINATVKDDFVEVSFTDNGVGMSESQISHVFDKFYKFGTPRNGMNSSGLGLAICENIVNKHGGQIRVESPGPGEGSTFYFTLKTK